MIHTRTASLLLVWLLALLAPLLLVAPQPAAAQEICFSDQPEIDDCLQEPFASYWQDNGGLAVFGYPISPAREEASADVQADFLTQWTERNRLEYHPELEPPYDVLLGRMGAERLTQLGRDPLVDDREDGQQAGCLWFEETGHNVCDQGDGVGFRSYWESNGLADPRLDDYGRSLALFGLPLTPAQMEENPVDGTMYLTQWFERARFEWHPDNPDEFKVLLGLLGNELRGNQPTDPMPEPAAEPQPVGPPETAPAGDDRFEFATEILMRQVGHTMDEASQTGLTWVRYNGIFWADVEPTEGARQWEALRQQETDLRLLSENGLSPVVIIRDTPAWARAVEGAACGPVAPAKLAAFADFLRDVVQRYSAPPYNVRHWELGNEPDIAPELIAGDSPFGCWGDQDDPYYGGGAYAEMLQRVYPVIKEADPQAQVFIGGLLLDCDHTNPPDGKECAPSRFLEGILQGGGGDSFDYVGYHAYTYWQPFAGDWDLEHSAWKHRGGALLGKADFLRSVMAAYGVNKPVVANEIALLCYGDPNRCREGTFRTDQAIYLVRSYTRAWADTIAGAMWFTLNDPGWRLGGLVPRTGDPAPAYRSLRFLSTLLQDASYINPLGSAPVEGYEFRSGTTRYRVYWTNDRSEVTVQLPGGTTRIYDMFGGELPLEGSSITVDHRPVVVQVGEL